jgi:hydroxymethylglutaryl-CoA reductase (NADPH)
MTANEDLTVNTNEVRKTNSAMPGTASRTYEEAAFKAARRWNHLDSTRCRDELFDAKAQMRAAIYQNNIESYIGTVSIPVGLAGPLKIHGQSGEVDYRVPLATTEAALVASYNRGARLLSAAGGCTARVVDQGVSRTPVFAFENLIDATRFADFIESQYDNLHEVVAQVTKHGKLLGAKSTIEGNKVYVDLRYSTGDACGQNMVTFASEAICKAILSISPVSPRHWFLEANFSGDKKASAKSMAGVRGKRVVAEITIPEELVSEQLHTTPDHMVDYWYAGAIGGVLSGTTGIQGHFANGIAALYLACGQDIACVAESAIGITRMETTDEGDLYTSVTLPNIMVGTVGGGTGLPSARACLDLLGLSGAGNSNALAEVCAGIVLAGELSIIGAFCSGDFASAHRSLSRGESMQGSK